MKSLIINADDIGFSDAVNEAARACYAEGRITGVSIMACGESFEGACGMLKEIGKKDVGIHLTLTGKLFPCTSDRVAVGTLLDEKGMFVNSYRNFALRYFMGKIDFEQVYLEFSNQIKRVQDAGLDITHMDSHEYVYMLPKVLEVAVKLAKEHKIPYLRLPLEPASVMLEQFSVKDFVRRSLLAMFSAGGKKIAASRSIKANDSFLGHFHAGRINYDAFCFMLGKLKEGINELAVHPAVSSESFFREFPWYQNAWKEFDFLMNEDWKKHLDEAGVQLVTHREAVENR